MSRRLDVLENLLLREDIEEPNSSESTLVNASGHSSPGRTQVSGQTSNCSLDGETDSEDETDSENSEGSASRLERNCPERGMATSMRARRRLTKTTGVSSPVKEYNRPDHGSRQEASTGSSPVQSPVARLLHVYSLAAMLRGLPRGHQRGRARPTSAPPSPARRPRRRLAAAARRPRPPAAAAGRRRPAAPAAVAAAPPRRGADPPPPRRARRGRPRRRSAPRPRRAEAARARRLAGVFRGGCGALGGARGARGEGGAVGGRGRCGGGCRGIWARVGWGGGEGEEADEAGEKGLSSAFSHLMERRCFSYPAVFALIVSVLIDRKCIRKRENRF